jgi:beta-galactosidase GanA
VTIPYGGDYNPEQWPPEVWEQDHRLFDAAHIDTLTVGVFTWALTQPAPDVHDFTVLDRIIARATAAGRRICLATGTGALPPWLARAHPSVTRTDFEGRKHRYGQRHNACPSSPEFRRLSADMARRIARRYAGNPAIIAWHVGNEYGGACYCPLCAQGFRQWLRVRPGHPGHHQLHGPVPAGRLSGPCAGLPDVETATRVAPDGSHLLFVLNHRPEPVTLPATISGTDLLTGDPVAAGERLTLGAYGVAVLVTS